MLLQDSHLTFGRIADEWAREVAAMPGGLARDKILHDLVRAVWRGEFEDEDGKDTVLMLHQPPPGGAWRIDDKFVDKNHMRTAETKPVGFNRRMLLCVLAFDHPHGLPLPPGDRLRGWHSPESDNPEPVSWSELNAEVRWDILDALTLDEYPGTFRWAYFEALTISKDDFGRWCDEQGRKRPKFWFEDGRQVGPGRPPGSSQTKARRQKVYDLFDQVVQTQELSFKRGEMTDLARKIAPETDYPWQTVRDLISPHYREKKGAAGS